MKKRMNRRDFLRLAGGMAAGAALAACQPQTVIVEKEVEKEVTRVVKETVKETVVVEGTPQIVEKEVTKVVTEKVEVPVEIERTEVSLLHFFGREADVRRAALDAIMGDFNVESSRHAVSATFVPFGNIDEKTRAGIAAGDPPDVVVSTGNDGGILGLEGVSIPLDAYFEASSLPAWTDENWVGYTISKWSNTGIDGKIYGIPFLPDTRFLFIDVAAFEEVGLDPDEPPETWDDLEEYADLLDAGAPGNWERIGFCPRWGNSYFMNWSFCMNLFLWDTLDDDGIPVLDRPEVRELIDWYVVWRDRYGKDDLDAFSASFTGTADPFISGVNPMVITGSWMPTRYRENFPDVEVTYALHPMYPGSGGLHSSWGAGHCVYIPTNAQNADGAWSFIEFLNQTERLTQWCIDTGTFVGRRDAMEVPGLADDVGPHWDLAVQQLTTTRTADFQYGTWPTLACHNAMAAVWDGAQSVEDALAEQQATITQEINDWRSLHPDVPYEPDLGYMPG
jgi:multiple sugar transport system substrate-binding protein